MSSEIVRLAKRKRGLRESVASEYTWALLRLTRAVSTHFDYSRKTLLSYEHKPLFAKHRNEPSEFLRDERVYCEFHASSEAPIRAWHQPPLKRTRGETTRWKTQATHVEEPRTEDTSLVSGRACVALPAWVLQAGFSDETWPARWRETSPGNAKQGFCMTYITLAGRGI